MGEIRVYRDGGQVRDFTFVDDVVETNIVAMDADVAGEVFNIGGGSRMTVSQTMRMLEEIVGNGADVRYVGPQKGDVSHPAADISKADRLLGCKSKVRMDEGLSKEIHRLRSSMDSKKV